MPILQSKKKDPVDKDPAARIDKDTIAGIREAMLKIHETLAGLRSKPDSRLRAAVESFQQQIAGLKLYMKLNGLLMSQDCLSDPEIQRLLRELRLEDEKAKEKAAELKAIADAEGEWLIDPAPTYVLPFIRAKR